MKALIVTLGCRGGATLLSISIEPLGRGDMFYTPSLPLNGVRTPWSKNMEAASIDAGSPDEIG